MDELELKYKTHYIPLWKEFLNKLQRANVGYCPEPQLPVYGKNYSTAKFKIAFVGIDNADGGSLSGHIKKDNYFDLTNRLKEELDNLSYCSRAWRRDFWRFIFELLSTFYGIKLEDLEKHESEEAQRILTSFVWGNVMSIEPFHIAAQSKGVAYNDWKKIKEASKIFNRAEHIMKVFEPDVLILLNWGNIDKDWFPKEMWELSKDPSVPLWVYHLKNSNTLLCRTKHPCYLKAVERKNIIKKILQAFVQIQLIKISNEILHANDDDVATGPS